MKKVWLIILAIIVLVVLWIIPQYNWLVALQENANTAWAQVENQYQRRADLIPNLVSTVKGFADQELEVFTEVVKARASATQMTVDIDDIESMAQFQEAQWEIGGALSRLLVTVEGYPELKSNENFMDLQKQLEGTENRIAVARMDFNNVVNKFNIAVRRIPVVFVAWYLWFDGKTLFQAEAGADVAPDVSFE